MNLTRDPSDAAIVRSTIDLARNLGLRVVAEGVDAGDVWRELEELGCDYVQGYYLSRPVEAERVRRLVTGLFGQARPLPAAPTPALVSRPHLVLVEASPDGPAGAPPRPWPTVGEPSP
jgi:EAL domain-containing protein (putative c-di-GMP-specific phosphodiesterase class I)